MSYTARGHQFGSGPVFRVAILGAATLAWKELHRVKGQRGGKGSAVSKPASWPSSKRSWTLVCALPSSLSSRGEARGAFAVLESCWERCFRCGRAGGSPPPCIPRAASSTHRLPPGHDPNPTDHGTAITWLRVTAIARLKDRDTAVRVAKCNQ